MLTYFALSWFFGACVLASVLIVTAIESRSKSPQPQ